MRKYTFTGQQKAAVGGYTDLYVLTDADLTETTVNTDTPVTLDTLNFGDVVEYQSLIEIKTAFAGGTADNACTVSLGVTGALTQFIGASAIASGGSYTAAKTAYCQAAGGAAYPTPTGGKSLIANFDITDADGALVDYTAGEIHIWVKISRYNERTTLLAS